MKVLNKGFTLIELVVVIVILGILAATALPKFIDLSGDANKAKANGIVGAIASGNSIAMAKAMVSGLASYTPACDATVLDGAGLDGCTAAGTPCVVTCETQASKSVTLPSF